MCSFYENSTENILSWFSICIKSISFLTFLQSLRKELYNIIKFLLRSRNRLILCRKSLPHNYSFSFGIRQQQLGDKSGECGECSKNFNHCNFCNDDITGYILVMQDNFFPHVSKAAFSNSFTQFCNKISLKRINSCGSNIHNYSSCWSEFHTLIFFPNSSMYAYSKIFSLKFISVHFMSGMLKLLNEVNSQKARYTQSNITAE